jgi:lipopolysaccharide transport system ATP-binding protein
MTVSVGLRTEIPHIIHCYEEDAVAFQIIESPDGDTARGDYAGRMRGVLRPYLKWTNEVVDSNSMAHIAPVERGAYGGR